MLAWGRAITTAMNGFHNESETGLVRMFRIEYAREYHQLKKMGTQLDDAFVSQYLKSNKTK